MKMEKSWNMKNWPNVMEFCGQSASDSQTEVEENKGQNFDSYYTVLWGLPLITYAPCGPVTCYPSEAAL